MNNGQRVQLNFLEQLPLVIVSTVIGGIAYPWWAFSFQMAFSIGRLLFSIGYTKCGPTARIPGALMCDLILLAGPCLAIASVANKLS